jgi:hypothetical protein
MSTLLEDLRKYFKETPQQQIASDWAKSEKYDDAGPSVDEFIESSRKYYYAVECHVANNNSSQIQFNNILINPKFLPSGLFFLN